MHVAVIEDNPDVSEVVQMMLGDTVTVAGAVGSIEDAYRLDWPHIDAAIIDRRLNDGLADDLVRWLAREYPQVKVLLLTSDPAYVIPEDLRHLWIQKPVGADDLREYLHG